MRSGKFGLLGSFSSSRLWTPFDLAVAPKVVLDDQSEVTDVSGNASTWFDRSANGWNFGNGTGSSQPLIVPGELNGRRVLRFDGTNDRLVHAGSGADVFRNVGAGWTLTLYKKRTGATPSNGATAFYTAVTSASSDNNRFHVVSSRAAAPGFGGFITRRLVDAQAVLTRTASDVGSWVARLDVADWANGDAYLWVNGALDVSDTTTMTPGNTSDVAGPGLMIGCSGTAASPLTNSYSDIDAAVLVIGSGSLPSTDEIAKLFGCYMWHFGLEGNLPIGHPYKDAPPMA